MKEACRQGFVSGMGGTRRSNDCTAFVKEVIPFYDSLESTATGTIGVQSIWGWWPSWYIMVSGLYTHMQRRDLIMCFGFSKKLRDSNHLPLLTLSPKSKHTQKTAKTFYNLNRTRFSMDVLSHYPSITTTPQIKKVGVCRHCFLSALT